MAINESAILKSELRWAMVVAGIVTVILGAILFAIYYANWTYGWISPDDLDLYN